MKFYWFIKQQIGYVLKIIVAILSFVSLWYLRSYFRNSREEKFIIDLRFYGFHPTVVHNPFILFRRTSKVKQTYYNHVLGAICLSILKFSFRIKCWNSKLSLSKMFSLIGINNAYCKNFNLLTDSNTISHYDRIVVSEMNTEKKNIVVYSVMIGDYDDVFDPVYVSDNCEYVLYTDQIDLKLDVWKIVFVDKNNFLGKTNKWISTYHKILAHEVLSKKYSYSIYLDTKVFVCGDITSLFNSIDFNCKLAFIKHTHTSSLAREMQNCVSFGFALESQTKIQYDKYLNEGFLDNLGLIDSCILIRQHNNPKVKDVMTIWFEEFNEFSRRDQFSIMYALWKSKVNYRILEGSVWSNQFSIIKRHK